MRTTFYLYISLLVFIFGSGLGRANVLRQDDILEELSELLLDQIVVPPEVDDSQQTDIEPRAACSVTIRGGVKVPSPLILKTGSSQMYPFNDLGAIEVNSGSTIELACPNGFAAPLSGKTAIATCVSGTLFKVNSVQYDFSQFICTSWAPFVGKKSGASCNGGTTLVNVGIQVDTSRFVKQYEVCFNEDLEVTRYVAHSLSPGSNYYATGVDRLTFVTGGFFNGKNVDKLYTQVVQQETIGKDLGYDPSGYFDTNKNIYLARGHMAAKADFVYGTEQRATFMFINVAPQWQVFNAGNWQRVEDNLRSWVAKTKKYVNCWTGVYGVTTLPNKNGIETPLYLAHDANNNGLIPVPMLYFRVIIEPATNKGIVLIGVNNPHLTLAQIKKDYIICTDVSDQITWLTWKKTDIVAGYSYACEVPEFRKKVTHLPNFSVSGLLL